MLMEPCDAPSVPVSKLGSCQKAAACMTTAAVCQGPAGVGTVGWAAVFSSCQESREYWYFTFRQLPAPSHILGLLVEKRR